MIRAAPFVLGSLAVLSAMGLLHFVLAVYPKHAYQHCLDEGFKDHCLYGFEGINKYVCKKLVCAHNKGGTMVAIDTGKAPDERSPCSATARGNNDWLVTKICIKGICQRILNGSKLQFTGEDVGAVNCWNRRGELFTGGSRNRAEKCPKRD